MLLVEELFPAPNPVPDLHIHALNIIIVILEDQHSSPPIQRSSQPQVPLPPVTDSIDQGWDNNEPSDPRRLSDNLMDFSFPVSPQQGSNFIAQSHIPLPPRMSLIPGPATSPQDRLFSLTAKDFEEV
ncbi:unnamed protein product [Rhizophagus irregularis]|nr:unnamed protein product [Rhizophagus irregularis]